MASDEDVMRRRSESSAKFCLARIEFLIQEAWLIDSWFGYLVMNAVEMNLKFEIKKVFAGQSFHGIWCLVMRLRA